MKTNVQTFCQEFSRELDPFGSRLGDALDALAHQSEEQEDLARLNDTVLSLREVQQRLSTLQEKIGGQQAFLLIFGPLKSGKSTLMNAISGAYVSEVSSLPAYPALVYVKNGEQRRFQATTYEGRKREFRDSLDMASAIQEDHARLASAILEVERAGGEFEPRQHYPEAIRRMDIEVPAPDLAESGSVLVDTPGLYSRMKFGYDQMTRDFRDTAACAIFVVKTDNLFFEKVFEEFEDLLGCFTRIFLVSNVDSSKQDLKPDGTLEASLESRDPDKIIEAFRSLSMSATLRQAIDEGRLNIYSIDLLRAASKRLRENAGISDEAAADPTAAGDGFDRFLEDLTGYLNSSDYLHDFMFDSLRVASDLTREAEQLAGSQAAEDLRSSTQEMRSRLYHDRERLAALGKLDQMSWSSVFDHLYTEKNRLLDEAARRNTQRLAEGLQEAVAGWMQGDDSWNGLVEGLNTYLERESGKDAEAIVGQLRALVDNPYGGARFSTSQLENFRQADLRIEENVAQLLKNLGREVDAGAPHIDIEPADVPLNRSLGDMLILRSGKQVRDQFFGPEGDQPIPAGKKQKRLGGPGEEALKAQVETFARDRLPAQQKDYVNRILNRYVEDFTRTLKQTVSNLKTSLNREVGECETKLEVLEASQKVLERIHETAENFAGTLAELQSRYGVEHKEAGGNGDGSAVEYGEDDYLNLDDSLFTDLEGKRNQQ